MNNNIEEGSITLRSILDVLRRNIILLVSVIVIVTLIGVGYAKTQEPDYTAKETVFFKAQDAKYDNTINNINIMQAFVETIMDFCDEGVVVDRADCYYEDYMKEFYKPANVDYTVDKYIQEMDIEEAYSGASANLNHYDSSKISVVAASESSSGRKPFSFTVTYTADNRELAIDKVKLLVKALKDECVAVEENGQLKYFNGVNVEIIDEGLESVTTNVSTVKTVLLFFALGIVASLIVVFAKHFLDNTIKTKEELERITGASVITVIDTQGGEK